MRTRKHTRQNEIEAREENARRDARRDASMALYRAAIASDEWMAPADLDTLGDVAVRCIRAFVANDLAKGYDRMEGYAHHGGCRMFYSPAEWRERGEEYGLKAALILCHDGATIKHAVFSGELRDALAAAGLYIESCTCWYSAIYPIQENA